MATQITQMCGIVYPVFAFTHCRDVVSIDFQKWGYLTGLTFTPDGKTMFVETAQPATDDPTGPPKKGAGKILRVSADGVVAEELPVVTGLDQPCSMLFAPKGFIRTVDSCLWLIVETFSLWCRCPNQ